MSNRLSFLILAMGLCPFTCIVADEGFVAGEEVSHASTFEFSDAALSPPPSFESTKEILEHPTLIEKKHVVASAIERKISPFTGKIKRSKVRVRVNADLDSKVIKEMNKNDYVVVVGEKGDFYAVKTPSETKAYVFRTYVLDGIVEGNRVNVRAEPSLDAPVIAQLNSGDHVDAAVCVDNSKWYEISPPENTHFYIAKELIERVGGPEVKIQLEKRKKDAQSLLKTASLLKKDEWHKSFNEIDISQVKQNYETLVREYVDFPEIVEQAQEALVSLQEEYLQKRIAFLEEKASIALGQEVDGISSQLEPERTALQNLNATDRMRLWEPSEEALYIAWTEKNDERSKEEFYEDQKQSAEILTGFIEPYTDPVKNKPGDYILRNGDLPAAYLYSTQVNLQEHVGKKVNLIVSERSNNHFAFPAYYVLTVE